MDGNGMPLSVTSTPASGSEREQVSPLLQRVKVYHGYGRPRRCPNEIHADRGCDSRILRIFLTKKGVRPVIPKRTWKGRRQPSGKKVPTSTSRFQVERCFAWMQRKFRRLVARWERRDLYLNGFLQISIIMIWEDKLI